MSEHLFFFCKQVFWMNLNKLPLLVCKLPIRHQTKKYFLWVQNIPGHLDFSSGLYVSVFFIHSQSQMVYQLQFTVAGSIKTVIS